MKTKNQSTEFVKRPPFKLDIPELSLGQTHPELAKVQSLLGKLNYLSEEGYESARLDTPTQTALKKYQAIHSLKQTGTTDKDTVDGLEQPRCGTPDPTEGLSLAHGEFVLAAAATGLRSGCDLRGISPVKYSIANTADELPDELDFEQVKGAIERALATWRKVIPIEFADAQGDINATLKFRWSKGSHGDTQKFDNVGGLLAHAFYPKDCGKNFSGQCHFDKAEKWGLNEVQQLRTFDLETVALHEIGHLLGLTHSSDHDSVMFDRHVREQRELLESDPALTAIQDIYGKPHPA